jgi:predicted ATPase/class 3 adenylate cyclase
MHMSASPDSVAEVPQRPAGTVTFLFSDIEGSTRLWESSPDRMQECLARHDTIVRTAVEECGGYVFATGGDGFAVVFDRVGSALAAATTAQERLAAEPWPDGGVIRVRMGLHTGEAAEREGDYFGPAVNRTARLMATAHGGQVVCSSSTASLAEGSTSLRSLGEHRLRDLAVPEQIFQVGGGTFPHLRTVDAVPTNLPTMRTKLVGRSGEVATLAEIVGPERLVTLTGVGGVGKTRLALEVAARVAPTLQDGCWLVDLAPLAEGTDVPMAVAAAIGAPTTESSALVEYLLDRHLLLLLDNCEHVIGDVADLVEAILESAEGVQVIATSREPLGLDGEVVRRVSSLVVPDADASPQDALTSPSVRLFVQRATAVASTFVLDESNVGAVIDICRRLDGIPLAIELAAARIRSMPPQDLSRRLDERFRLLGGGSRRAQERHRTLLATVSWSYDLLEPAERAVFRRLAVFPASFSLEAAEEVAGQDDEPVNVTDSLLGLVDRSLVQFDPNEGRYRLLETLRQFAADRLGESGETEVRRERHAEYFLGLVDRHADDLLGADYLNARTTLTAEVENVRAMATWLIDEGRWATLASLCRSTLYFAIQSSPVDGVTWRQLVIDHREVLEDEVVIETLSELAYILANSLGDHEVALAIADQALALGVGSGRMPSLWALVARTYALNLAARYEETVADAKRSLEVADAAGDEALAVIALGILCSALAALGQREESTVVAQEALRRGEASGHPLHMGAAVITYAASYLTQTATPDFEAAWEIVERYPLTRAVGGTNAMWFDLMWGWSLLGLGEPQAVECLVDVLRAADRLNAQPVSDIALRLLALAFDRCGHAKEGMILSQYADAHLQRFRLPAPGQSWVQAQLDLAGIGGTRSVVADSNRAEIMALVNTTTFSIVHSRPVPGGEPSPTVEPTESS